MLCTQAARLHRADDQRFLRLLEILGEHYEHGKVIVFVQSQDRADHLFRDLLRVRGRAALAHCCCAPDSVGGCARQLLLRC